MKRGNFSRKAQSGGDAAIMLVVITVILVLYILIIPPEARQALLDGNVTDEEGRPAVGTILLREHPGTLRFTPQAEKDFSFPSFRVSTRTEGTIIKSQNSLYVRNSAFETTREEMTFTVAPSLTENVILTANVQRGQGRLRIVLNDEITLYEGTPTGNLPPLFINRNNLRSENKITFSVSSPGIAFWRVNEYTLTNVQVVGDVTDISGRASTQTFNLDEDTYNNIRTATLRYLPSCPDERNIQQFEIYLNHELVLSGQPDCEVFNHLTLSQDQFQQGRNQIEFYIERGNVLVDRLELKIRVQEPDAPIYYFRLSDRDFVFNETLADYQLRPGLFVDMELFFPNPERRRLEVFINGVIIGINTDEINHRQDIRRHVRPGTNSIEVRPRQTMTITELRVVRR